MAVPELVWTEVDSSNVKAIAYHEPSETLCVEFHAGTLYTYSDVDHEIYVDLVHAQSVGKYLNQFVKTFNGYTKWNSMLDLMDNLASK